MVEPRTGALRWLWVGLTSVLVIGSVAYPFLRELRAAPTEAPPPGETRRHEGWRAMDGRQYYVLLSAIEVTGKNASGNRWDVGSPAPDLYYEIRWNGTVVFRSSRKDNTLLARWNAGALDVADLIGKVSVDDSMEAARITVRPGESLEFIVYDHDVAADDEIARWSKPVSELSEGDQSWTAPADLIVSAICRVIPIDDVDLGTLTR